jgi:hypothetical protein
LSRKSSSSKQHLLLVISKTKKNTQNNPKMLKKNEMLPVLPRLGQPRYQHLQSRLKACDLKFGGSIKFGKIFLLVLKGKTVSKK